jgi:hypothetical protein
MQSTAIGDAITWLEKSNADLEPELLTADAARELLASYARAEKLAAYGRTMLATRLGDASEVARTSGTSMGKAKATVETAKALKDSDQVRDAFKTGAISLDQASEIARAEEARPGAAAELLPWPTPRLSRCYGSGPARSSWRPNNTETSPPASMPPGPPAATPRPSA